MLEKFCTIFSTSAHSIMFILLVEKNMNYIEKALTVLSSTPPRKAKASKKGKRKKGSDLKRSSMKKTPGARAPMAHAQLSSANTCNYTMICRYIP